MEGAAQVTPARSGPRIGEWLSESFSLFQREWQVWCLQGLLFVLIGYGPLIAASIAFMVMMPPETAGPEEALRRLGAASGVLGIGGLAWALTSTFCWCGMTRTAARQLRGERIAVGDMFRVGSAFVPALGAALVLAVGYFVGVALCVVPGLLVYTLLSFAHPLVVEGRRGVGAALGESWRAVAPHLWLYLLWFVLIALIGSVGSNFCLVGMAVTWPIYVIALVVSYRDVFGLEPDR